MIFHINYYDKYFQYENYIKIADLMPNIVNMNFNNNELLSILGNDQKCSLNIINLLYIHSICFLKYKAENYFVGEYYGGTKKILRKRICCKRN